MMSKLKRQTRGKDLLVFAFLIVTEQAEQADDKFRLWFVVELT